MDILSAASAMPTIGDDATLRADDASPSGRATGPLARGQVVGRYVVIERVGMGGMGVVYSAYDPDLDRRVALKLLTPGPGGAGHDEASTARLLREAQAMARVNHPQVITVYDVGTVDGSVFIAMEYLDGGTLRTWRGAADRPLVEIMDRYVRAGRGLAAAHAAGLVHRDFKPDNVLLGLDGRVRVSDFGLAREHEAAELTEGTDGAETGSTSLTRTGALAGTPAYMAPEQHLGSPADARSDQFSFCVALHEALSGQRPWSSETRAPLVIAMANEPPAELPPSVPESLRRAVAKGLAQDPAQRFASMDALLAALSLDRPRSQRAWWLGTGAAVALALGAAWAMSSEPPMCTGGPSRMAEVWSPSRAAELTAAIRRGGPRYAEEVAEIVGSRLDAYSSGWVEAYGDACRATRVLGEQSEQLLDLRMSCLDHRLVSLESMVEVLGRSDPDLAQSSIRAVASLPRLEVCADRDALLAAVPPPSDPETAAAVQRSRAALTQAEARLAAGLYDEAAELASQRVAELERLGYDPALAEAVHVLGSARETQGDLELGVESYERAFHLALASGDDRRALLVSSDLAYAEGYLRHQPARGLLWADHADALVERVDADAGLLAKQKVPRAVILVSRASTLREGTAMLERALELASSVTRPDELDLRTIRGNLAAAYAMQGEYARTLSILEEVIADTEREQGPHHPDLASHLTNYASALVASDRIAEALPMVERALAIRVEAVGPEHMDVAGIHAALGQYLLLDGQVDPAEEHLRLALELSRKHGTEVDQAEVMVRLANLQSQREHRDDARSLYREALGIFERRAPEHPFIATTMANLAEEAIVLRDWEQVLAWTGRSVAQYEQSLGPAHPQLHGPLYNMGQAHRELGQLAESVHALERSLTMLGPNQPVLEADTSMQLAYTLWDQGQQRPRARALAERARAQYEQAGLHDKTAAATTWLSEHGP